MMRYFYIGETRRRLIALLGLTVGLCAQGWTQAFTYQGFLRQNGAPVNNPAQPMQFRIYNLASAGTLLWDSGTLIVNVQGGLFSVQLNTPASVWTGADRYLEIQVGAQTLAPRVRINPTPYASFALRPWVISGSHIFYNSGNVGIGTGSPVHLLHVETGAGDRAVYARHTANSGITAGGWFESSSAAWGVGVFGYATSSSGNGWGVMGRSDSSAGMGVHGWASAASGTTYGVFGRSDSNTGIGVYGIAGAGQSVAYGVFGESRSEQGRGVYGWANAATGSGIGVLGRSDAPSGTGVYGWAANTGVAQTYGVTGKTDSVFGAGVYGVATAADANAWGVYGVSASAYGVAGVSQHPSNLTAGGRFVSLSTNGTGVEGEASATTGGAWGVSGETNSGSSNGYGVIGFEPSGGAGHAIFASGSLAAIGFKAFQIDHPLRPETHYLNHFCAESSEPYNFYSGVATLDARGEAWVQLPEYFERINRDPRYTLTPIGAPMPNLHVAVEIQQNRFKIAGGAPGRKVSWRVEAIRNDPYIQRYGYQTEQEKEDALKGKYLRPELYGQPAERGILHRPKPTLPTSTPTP